MEKKEEIVNKECKKNKEDKEDKEDKECKQKPRTKIEEILDKMDDENYKKLIEELENMRNTKILSETEINKLHLISTDCSFSLEHRLKAINTYYHIFPENTNDIIVKLGVMYMFSYGIKSLEEYLYEISMNSELDIYLKLESAKYLSNFSKRALDCIDYNLNKEYETNLSNLSTPYKLEVIYLMMSNSSYREKAIQHLSRILSNKEIECLYKYKSILSIEHKVENEEDRNYYIYNSILFFINYIKDIKDIRIKITACQNICCNYQKYDASKGYEECQKILLEISESRQDDIDYNTKADSADVLLQYGTEEYKSKARNIIDYLGLGDNKTKTIFDNAQNVHTKAIEESSNKLLNYLLENNPHIKFDFESVQKEINKIVERFEKDETDEKYIKKLNSSLVRISIDRSIYGNNNLSLSTILCLIYTHINKSDFKEEMEKRLIEELVESSDICSSGYVTRMLNVLSGFEGDYSIRIGFDDQIIANVKSRLNKELQNETNEEYVSLILEEMTISSDEYDKRKNFLKFFREKISNIREELKEEYIKYMDEPDFDLYFKKAILHYEGNL